MKNTVKTLAVVALMVLIAAPLAAQDDGKKKGKKAPQRGGREAQLLKSLEQVNLTAEQKEKVNAILATYRPKLERVAAAIKVTPEQRRAAAEARKAAVADGKKGQDLQKATQAAMNLSADQIAARKKQQEIIQAQRKEIMAVLTAEQQEKLHGKKAEAAPGKKRKK